MPGTRTLRRLEAVRRIATWAERRSNIKIAEGLRGLCILCKNAERANEKDST